MVKMFHQGRFSSMKKQLQSLLSSGLQLIVIGYDYDYLKYVINCNQL